jgi:hypothetical protein
MARKMNALVRARERPASREERRKHEDNRNDQSTTHATSVVSKPTMVRARPSFNATPSSITWDGVVDHPSSLYPSRVIRSSITWDGVTDHA